MDKNKADYDKLEPTPIERVKRYVALGLLAMAPALPATCQPGPTQTDDPSESYSHGLDGGTVG